MPQLVLLRHGESVWNQQNIFTGWTDVRLSAKGVGEAHRAGHSLLKEGYAFDVAFTSVLSRAIQTLWIVLEELDLMWIPENLDWRLNERHYGALQGLNKADTAKTFGDEQVKKWRRSFDSQPMPLDDSDMRSARWDIRYKRLRAEQIPRTESLKDLEDRFMPYWEEAIVPAIRKGQRVLIVTHGNTLRALVKHLDHLSRTDILDLNIPTGIPLIYQLDENLSAISHQYLFQRPFPMVGSGSMIGQDNV